MGVGPTSVGRRGRVDKKEGLGMKTHRRASLQWVWLAALLGALVLPACQGKKKKKDEEEKTADVVAVEPGV